MNHNKQTIETLLADCRELIELGTNTDDLNELFHQPIEYDDTEISQAFVIRSTPMVVVGGIAIICATSMGGSDLVIMALALFTISALAFGLFLQTRFSRSGVERFRDWAAHSVANKRLEYLEMVNENLNELTELLRKDDEEISNLRMMFK